MMSPGTSPSEAEILNLLQKKDQKREFFYDVCHQPPPFMKSGLIAAAKRVKGQLEGFKLFKRVKISPRQEAFFKKFQAPPAIFNLKTLKFALEFCEEEAFADEEKHKIMEKTCALTPNKDESTTSKNEIHGLGEESLLSEMRHQINRDLSKMNKKFEEEKQKLLFEKQREFEEHKKAAVSTSAQHLAKLKAARQLKKKKQDERIKQYFIETEETYKKLEEEHKREQQVIVEKFKNRQEEAARRQRVKYEQGKERMGKGRQVKNECDETAQKLALHLQDPKFSCFTDHPTIVANMNTSRKVMEIMNHSTHADLVVMDTDHLQHLHQCHINFHEAIYNCKKQLDQLRAAKNIEEAEHKKKMEEFRIKEEQDLKAKKEKEMKEKNPERSLPRVPKELELSVSRGAYQVNKTLTEKLNEYQMKSDQVVKTKTAENKSTTMDIRKIISRAFSSITDRAGSDLKNCLDDLHRMLKGENLKVGNRQLNVRSIDMGLEYAQLQISKSFVKQSEDYVSSSHKGAYPLAFTILGVWSEDCTFGELYLAQLQTRCPFVIPMYPPPTKDGQSVEDYSRSLGYKVVNGKIEDQEIYLKRMSGMIRTYAAIIQSSTPPGCRRHPHGIEHGWIWLSRLLNMEPRKGLTATILYDFLDVAAHAMHASYGKEFIKLLNMIEANFIVEIEKVSNGQFRGPTERLRHFLQECNQASCVRKPEGHLEKSFWNTYHETGIVGG